MENAGDTSDGDLLQCQGTELLLPALGSQSSGTGCPSSTVEVSTGVCVSAIPVNSQGVAEDLPRESPCDSHSAVLATSAMVQSPETYDGDRTDSFAIEGRSTAAGPPPASQSGTPETYGLVTERRRLEMLDLSENVISTILKARKATTNRTYARVYERFLELARVQHFSPCNPSKNVLDFLQGSLELGLAYNTLKVHLSALAALTKVCWAADPLIIQFMKGVVKIRPPQRTLFPKWDL